VKDKYAGYSNVVSIAPGKTDQMYRALAQVEAYWDGLVINGRPPRRADIDPRGIEDVLEYTFVLERIAPNVGRFRVAGMHLNDLMGMDVRGMPLSAMFLPEARRDIGAAMENVCKTPAVTRLTLTGDKGIGKPGLDAQLLLAPLTDEFGGATRILGCLQAQGAIGRQPRRFGVLNCETRMNLPQADAYTRSIARERPMAGFAAPHAQYAQHSTKATPQKRPGVTRPALRLVTSND